LILILTLPSSFFNFFVDVFSSFYVYVGVITEGKLILEHLPLYYYFAEIKSHPTSFLTSTTPPVDSKKILSFEVNTGIEFNIFFVNVG